MTDTITVVSSGATFSLLLYENVKIDLDDEKDGLILGEVISRETHKLTDSDRSIVIRHDKIFIKSIVPCPAQFFYYNAAGEIDESKLKVLLENNFDNFIGWYIFKRDSSKLTLREKVLHKNLMQFSNNPTFFTNCIVTSNSTSNNSTLTSTQIFTRFNMCEFERLPLQITNLSDQFYVLKSSEASRNTINEFIKSIRNTKKDVEVEDIQAALTKRIKGLIDKVSSKENDLFTLEQEIKELQEEQRLERESYKSKHKNNDNNVEPAESKNSGDNVFEEEMREEEFNTNSKSLASNEEVVNQNIKERKVLECKRKLSTKKSEATEEKMDIEDVLSNDEEEIQKEVVQEQTKKRRGKSKLKTANNVEHHTPLEPYSRKTRSSTKTYAETTQNK